MVSLSGFTSLLCFAIGFIVFWSNPRRLANQCFALLSAILTLRFFGIAMAIDTGNARLGGQPGNPFAWLRFVSMVGAFTPWGVWLLRESILAEDTSMGRLFRSSLRWFVVCAVYSASALSNHHIREVDLSDPGAYGILYKVTLVSFAIFQVIVLAPAVRALRTAVGVRRVELVYVVLNFWVALTLMGISALIRVFAPHEFLRPATHVILLLSYLVAAWAIANRRIFDARDALLAFAPRALALAGFLASAFAVLRWHDHGRIPTLPSAALLVAFAFAALATEVALRRRFGLDHRSKLQHLRQRLLAATATATDPAVVAAAATSILREEFGSSGALLAAPPLLASEHPVDLARPGLQALGEIGWASHESLLRTRPTPALADLQEFMRQHRLQVLVPAAAGRHAPTLVLGLGGKLTGHPYAYGEIQRLQDIADLVAGLLARARLASQAALEARMAHLALMSRGLAHDLKNLITPISSFLVHTEDRFPPGTPEGEVYRDARRSVRLMTDYVRESHFFSSRLQPHFEPLDAADLFRRVHDTVRSTAHARGVDLVFAVPAPVPFTGDRVLLQRLLVNLVQNALDASSAGGAVTLRAAPLPGGGVRIEVVDTGAGIPAENLPRIFEPYFTTKQFGEEIRGFGLGLAIAEKIAHLHRGSLRVTSSPGRGTAVALDLPAAPPAAPPPDLPPPAASAPAA